MGRVLLSCIIVSLYYCNMQNAHVTIINDLLTYLLILKKRTLIINKCSFWTCVFVLSYCLPEQLNKALYCYVIVFLIGIIKI